MDQSDPLQDPTVIRHAYPGLGTCTYLDTSSCGLVARSTMEAAQEEEKRLVHEGSARFLHWMTGGMDAVAREVAASIGGTAQGTALVPNCSVGMGLLAQLTRHRAKVLLIGDDYPTLHAPFALPGSHRVFVRPQADGSIDMEALGATMERERPQLVAIGHVQWLTGYRVDLDAIAGLCRAFGAWSMIDITQSWCAVPIDAERTGIDILCGSGYKWPLAGFGNGFVHLSPVIRAELEERNGVDPIAYLNAGHRDPVAFTRAKHALERIGRLGTPRIAAYVDALCTRAVAKCDEAGITVLNGRSPDHRAGILLLAGDEAKVNSLARQGIRVALRGAGIRVGIHFYNTAADIERLVEAWHAD